MNVPRNNCAVMKVIKLLVNQNHILIPVTSCENEKYCLSNIGPKCKPYLLAHTHALLEEKSNIFMYEF